MVALQINQDASADARTNMVECQLKPAGVRDYRLTLQIRQTPREAFIADTAYDLAYADLELECVSGDASRKMLTPTAFARLAELANVQADDVVLDIGGGTGYTAAVLARLATTVIVLEDSEAMVETAGEIWQELGVDNAVAVCGPLNEGQAKQGPFNVIFVNGCIADVPQNLLEQLADGGRLVCMQWVDGTSKAHIYTRMGDSFASRAAFDMAAPRLTAFDPAPAFEF